MKKILTVILVSAASAGVFWFFGPAHLKDRVKGVATFATDERLCFNFHKDNFLDPETAYIGKSYVHYKKDITNSAELYVYPILSSYDAAINVEVHAKNAMGGYISNYVECPLINLISYMPQPSVAGRRHCLT